MARKGNGGELEVVKLLAPWWQQLEPGAVFARTPGSGGWRHAAEFEARGDIIVKNAPRFPWCVEVKRVERWSVQEYETGAASQVWSWWSQAQGQAADVGLEPMLWFRKNRQPWRVLVRADWTKGRRLPRPSTQWRAVWEGHGAIPVEYPGAAILALPPCRFALQV